MVVAAGVGVERKTGGARVHSVGLDGLLMDSSG
jgi:hypothetical protein